MNNKTICPHCERETSVEQISAQEKIDIRGTPIEIEVQYLKCLECKEEFDNPQSEDDPLEKAYEKYRLLYDLLKPDEIKSFRKNLGLTQGEISKILGWGSITLSRYENGFLQDETHDKALRLAMEPGNLLKLLERTPNALSKEKYKRLSGELHEAEKEAFTLNRYYEEQLGNYEADIYSGFKKLSLTKLFNSILFLCKGGVVKTKLCKLLFYADFKHYQEYSVSINGCRYAHLPHGPVPKNFVLYFAALVDEESITIEEKIYAEDMIGEIFYPKKNPDISLFSESELKILATVKEHFQKFTARKISDFSHKEKGYEETNVGDFISYDYAEELNW